MTADGADCSTRSAGSPTTCAATTVGDDVTYVVNRNINFTNVCYTGCRFCAFAQRRTDADAYTLSLDEVADRAEEAWDARRHRGLHAGRHRPRPARHGVLRPRPRGEGARARACTCTRSRPMEVVNGAARTGLSIEDFLIEAQRGRPRHRSPAPPPRSSTTTSAGC